MTGWANQRLYHQIFIVVCLIAFLLPCYGVADFRHFEKNFWGRSWLIRAYADICLSLQNRTFDLSIIGDGDWLIFTEELDDYQKANPFTDETIVMIQRKMDRLADRLEKQGVKKLIVVIAPNKSTIYPEYIPDAIPIVGRESRLDQLLAYEKHHGKVKILDVRPVLLEAKKQYPVFYRTDTHWNQTGSFLVYQAIMKEVQTEYPKHQPRMLNDFQIMPKQYTGDISRMMIKADIVEDTIQFVPLFHQNTTTQVWWSEKEETPNRYLITTVSHPDSTLPKLVMFRDSFSTDIEPLIIDHFSRSVLIWYPPSEEKFYEIEKPDVVIIEIVERNLQNLLEIPD